MGLSAAMNRNVGWCSIIAIATEPTSGTPAITHGSGRASPCLGGVGSWNWVGRGGGVMRGGRL